MDRKKETDARRREEKATKGEKSGPKRERLKKE